ncbi:MAG TPA: DUF6157 family protein [Salinimicrobium sp.]|nr:DUF6157 family protein [Salinimicrobium sp.]
MKTKNKLHTTNYFDTFIEVAEDSKAVRGEVPKSKKDKKTIAELQFELLVKNPYKYTSDDIFFKIFALRNDLIKAELEQAKKDFFSKGQACFRASLLPKKYGFGVHCDHEGKVAIFGMETEAYQKFFQDPKLKKLKAMRTSKK